jgi:phage/plasmid-like protein (TIGR03299 family)
MTRSDNGGFLGIVGTGYVPIQHAAQAAFIAALVGEGATVDTVGALDGGRRQFWTVKAPGEIVVQAKGGSDQVARNLIVANAHDGSMAFKAFWSPIRVVCHNTLTAALRGSRDGINIRHAGDVSASVDDARETLGLADAYFRRLGETAQVLAEREVLAAEVDAFLDSLFPLPVGETAGLKASRTRLESVRGQVVANFEGGVGSDLAGRTAWGLWNAVTEYASHQRDARGDDETAQAEARFDSLILGSGRELSQRALAQALELVTA